MRLCLSVGPSVCRSVRPLVRVYEWKSWKRSVLDMFCLSLSINGALGMYRCWTPLPTRPQRYCDPASLVIGLHSLSSHFDIHLSIHPSAMLTLRIANECSGKEQDPVGKKSLFDFHGLSLEAKRHFTIPSTCNLLLFCPRKLNSFIHSSNARLPQ